MIIIIAILVVLIGLVIGLILQVKEIERLRTKLHVEKVSSFNETRALVNQVNNYRTELDTLTSLLRRKHIKVRNVRYPRLKLILPEEGKKKGKK